jgi:protein translocase SecG subunit
MIIFLLTLFIISIVLLIPAILLQSNGADNGMFSSNITAGAFGARSNEVLVKFTTYCVTIFIVSALLLSIHFIRATEVSAAPTGDTIEQTIPVEETTEDIVPLPISE